MKNNLNAVEYEKKILGYIINNNDVRHINILKYLDTNDFYDVRHQIIFKTILELINSGNEIELITLIQELTKKGELQKAGGKDYLILISQEEGLKSNLTKYAMEINNYAKLRKILISLNGISQNIISKSANAYDVLETISNKMLGITPSKNSKGFQTAYHILENAINIISKKASNEYHLGIETQYKELDQMIGGFQPGDLVILASRPSMGKTAFSLNLAANISRSKNVAFFSLEMPSEQLVNRILSMRTSVDSSKLRKPEFLGTSDWDKIYHFKDEIKGYKLFIDDTPGLKLSELLWKAHQLARSTNKPDIIIIDYMQLITTKNNTQMENRQAEVTKISISLKQLARELQIPVIALAQLSRRVEQREIKIPIMSDLRESGSIEQDADIIMFLYREDYYKTKEEFKSNIKKGEEVDIIIAKHRNGETGKVKLFFEPSLGRFTSIVSRKVY